MKIGIIGGGAAGFFAAINAAEKKSDAEVYILEKSNKLLSKVKISGGGRCNVTNSSFENYNLIKNYPRGAKELRKAFDKFSVKDTINWFESKGVKLKTEEDKRIFPISNDSQTIIDCFLQQAAKLKIRILTGYGVKKIILPNNQGDRFTLVFLNDNSLQFDRILIATGGAPSIESYNWLKETDHKIIPPVPSLFTFNIPESKFKGLQGIAINTSNIKIAGIKSEQEGPLLITHWGLSGPSILRLSAWEARRLNEMNYNFSVMINFIPEYNEESIKTFLKDYKSNNPKKVIVSNPLFNIPRRLWERITELAEISESLKWGDLPQKNMNKLIEELIRNSVQIKGKTTFKEEFVTCGGIDLNNVNFETMESKVHKGIYFAGEVLDIDGITGGFNFQAAWTTGYIAGNAIAKI